MAGGALRLLAALLLVALGRFWLDTIAAAGFLREAAAAAVAVAGAAFRFLVLVVVATFFVPPAFVTESCRVGS